MTIGIIILILLTHWIGDFILQTDVQAKNKSKSNRALFFHVLTYSIIWFGALTCYELLNLIPNITKVFIFTGITFVCHFITDYFTSRLNTKLWEKGDVHNFFVSIGFDQILHYIQLILTFKYIFG